jgi:ferredoxin--NADP+ reductase
LHKIFHAEWLAPDIRKIILFAPKIAAKRQPGQFVIVHLRDGSERIPLTIVDSDIPSGTITLIVQGIGKSTKELNSLKAGDSIRDVVGPLGKPSLIKKWGKVVVIGGGVGAAIAYPTAIAVKEARNHTICILGARTKKLVILEREMRTIADELYVVTDDGSYGKKGLVTTVLNDLLLDGTNVDHVFAIGPIPMMKAVAECTRAVRIPTTVSLNPIMVDGTGMCGGCRATVGGETVFVCVDGPEFDAHLVDFEILEKRNRSYKTEERQALEQFVCKTGSALAEQLQ